MEISVYCSMEFSRCDVKCGTFKRINSKECRFLHNFALGIFYF
jgi:hypothetical protein